MADEDKERRRLLGVCRSLKPAEAMVLQLLSVVYAPVAPAELAQAARRYNAGLSALGDVLAALAAKGVMESTPDGLVCHPLIREPLTQAAIKSGSFHSLAGVVRDALWRELGWMESELRTYAHGVARLRVALYQGNARLYRELQEQCERRFPAEAAASPAVALVCANPADCGFLRALPVAFQIVLLRELLNHSFHCLRPADHFMEMLEALHAQSPDPRAAAALATQWIYRGRFAKALKYAKALRDHEPFFRAWVDVLSGRWQPALETLEALDKDKKASPLPAAFYLLCLLRAGRQAAAAQFADKVEARTDDPVCRPFVWLSRQRASASPAEDFELPEDPSPLAVIFAALAWHWESAPAARGAELQARLEDLFARARAGGYQWLAVEAAALLTAWEEPPEVVWAAKLANALRGCKCSPLVDAFPPRPPWERPLAALEGLAAEQALERADDFSDTRLIWQIAWNDEARLCELAAFEQHLTQTGQWGAGHRLKWQQLYQPETPRPYLTGQDLAICAAITRESRDGATVYELDYDRALPAIVGHPLVFLADNKPVRAEIVSGEPELLVSREPAPGGANPEANADAAAPEAAPAGVRLALAPAVVDEEKVVVARETATRFRVTLVKPVHWRIQRILGPRGMSFPAAALGQVKTVVGKLCAFLTVQSEIGGVAAEARELPLDARLRAQLTPQQDGLQIDFFVAPLGDGGPYRRPGCGGAHIYHPVDGVNCHVERHLENEVKALEEAIAACPSLEHGERTGSGGWRLDDAIDCLELLLQLQELGEKVVLEWPKGGRKRVERALTPSAMSVRVARKNDWFEMSGDVKVNEELTLSMQELLRLAASATGRFVRLSADQYLALTDSFKRRLQDLAAFGDLEGDALRLSPLAALAVQDLAGEAGEFAADVAWKEQVARLSAPGDVPVPEGLQGELRDYQLAGFKWMANLAAWGLGACLADDMGLGKTVQTLALLLHRAGDGPALVVAPTSVCFNWAQEGARFAPGLRFSRFEGEKDERAALVTAVGKNDVVVCSYAMLQMEEELLTGREWATVVLDEAQAIKNAATKRSQAAKKLSAVFRLVTTGTPIENHLGELWNLFNFLNPRLLGSHKRFQERFAIPIEKDEDAEARGRLKRLLRPFILRRVKADVLTELPSRTEIEKTVPMSEAELAFYEALRRQAVERLNEPAAPREQRNFRILAEIMRLRRACCNPRLVAPDSEIESSKMAEFGRIVDDLRENGHRALVFSQFVDHLSLVREYLDGRGIVYQYLDGSTPERNRRRVVKDFQDGKGDLFLISLKAGGLGLNLTAADYVIHLDPWWNPAVEDQASDRAHRIGQTRPVTIYRLVMADSIEAKIVELHRRKRDLAESLLGDSDLGGRLNPEELLKLISEGG